VGSVGGAPKHRSGVHLRANPAVEIRDHTAVQAMRVRRSTTRPSGRVVELAVTAYPPYEEYQTTHHTTDPVFLAEPRRYKARPTHWRTEC